MFYVVSRYFNNGSIEAQIYSDDDFKKLPPDKKKEVDNREYTQYVDQFESLSEAKSHYRECLANSSKKIGNTRPAG